MRVVVLALLSISTAWGQQAAPEPEPAPVADEPLIEGPAVVE
ncbi:MAG: hypothetical protein ACI9K2_003281, partial [Myxococcota bacterium]